MNNSKNSIILAGTIVGTLFASSSAYASTYQVKSGDTLDKISKANQTTVLELKAANHLTGSLIYPGQVLKIDGLNKTTKKSSDTTKKYVVKLGDSLSTIAKRHNLSLNALLKLNPAISNSDRIYIGQAIRVSGQAISTDTNASKSNSSGTYTVKPGDTLGQIAKAKNMTLQQLKSVNRLSGSLIFPGQVLKITTTAINNDNNVNKQTVEKHVVKLGDSLSSIAKKYNLSLNALLKLNPAITNSNRIKIGQTITVSGKTASSTANKPSISTTKSAKANQVLTTGAKYMGAKYVYGASTSRTDVFDCSSFTLKAFQAAGISLPRTSLAQSRAGASVSSNNLQKGDLVFFDTNGDGVINHVGIYAGNGQMLNASTSNGVSYANINSSYWGPRFIKAVRVLN